jgi:hypothetical protein
MAENLGVEVKSKSCDTSDRPRGAAVAGLALHSAEAVNAFVVVVAAANSVGALATDLSLAFFAVVVAAAAVVDQAAEPVANNQVCWGQCCKTFLAAITESS